MKFYPRMDKMNKQGIAPIYARIMADKKIELATTMSTIPNDWNIKSQRVYEKTEKASVINPFLDSFQSKILDAYLLKERKLRLIF